MSSFLPPNIENTFFDDGASRHGASGFTELSAGTGSDSQREAGATSDVRGVGTSSAKRPVDRTGGPGPNQPSKAWAVLAALLGALAIWVLVGCEAFSNGDRNLNDAGAGVGGITTLVDLSKDESNIGGLRKILKAIGDKALDVGASIGYAQESAAKLKHENQNLKSENAQLKNDLFSPRQKRYARIFCWLLALAALLRGLGVMSVGWIGTVASYISTGIVALCTGGISLITTIGDNIHFRSRIAKEKEAADAAKSEVQQVKQQAAIDADVAKANAAPLVVIESETKPATG